MSEILLEAKIDRPPLWFWHEPGEPLTQAQVFWVLDHGGFDTPTPRYQREFPKKLGGQNAG
jgi:hypothetical protein